MCLSVCLISFSQIDRIDLDKLSLCSWGRFCMLATPRQVHHCSKFSQFVNNGPHRDSLESQL